MYTGFDHKVRVGIRPPIVWNEEFYLNLEVRIRRKSEPF